MKRFLLILLWTLSFCTLNAQNAEVADSDSIRILDLTPQQKDSLIFRLTHHYTDNFNFLVKADTLILLPREGDLIQDTCRATPSTASGLRWHTTR